MDKLEISEVIKVVNGKAVNCDDKIVINNITRSINYVRKGSLFIPLVGTTSVSEKLIETARQKGAAAAIVPNHINSRLPQIVVENTVSAYVSLYKYYRSKFQIPVIGITGSAGKTSTKEMLAQVLGQKFKICKTFGNLNDVFGTVRTVYRIDHTLNAAVFEIGFSGHYGYIKTMANIARPNIAVITNISTGHYQILGSKENIMKAKMEVTTYFDKDSILIINNDDECLSTIKDKPYKIIRVSTQGKGDFNAYDIVDKGEQGVEFKCTFRKKEYLFKINVPGVHFVYSALICIAIGDLLNIDAEQIKKGIENFRPSIFRMNIINLKDNIKIINDCYNANLASMKSGIDVLKSFKGGRKIAILGDILEQGIYSEDIHRQLGKYMKDKCDIVITIGKDSSYICEETKNQIKTQYFNTKEEACRYLEVLIQPNDVILIKASRGLQLESIANHLIKTKG